MSLCHNGYGSSNKMRKILLSLPLFSRNEYYDFDKIICMSVACKNEFNLLNTDLEST